MPKGSIWHSQKIVATSKDLNIIVSISENRVLFSFDLLKHNDFFLFEIFTEIGEDKHYESIFLPGHRIVNLGPIEKKKYEFVGGILPVSIITGAFSLFMLGGSSIGFYYALTSPTLGLDYNSSDISNVYYYDNNKINVDSLSSVFSYRKDKWNAYADKTKIDKPSDDSLYNFEYNSLVIIQEGLRAISIDNKPKEIFNREISRRYKFWDLYDPFLTDKFNLTEKFYVRFKVDIEKPIEEITGLFLFGIFFLIISIFSFYYWYKNRELDEKISQITKISEGKI